MTLSHESAPADHWPAHRIARLFQFADLLGMTLDGAVSTRFGDGNVAGETARFYPRFPAGYILSIGQTRAMTADIGALHNRPTHMGFGDEYGLGDEMRRSGRKIVLRVHLGPNGQRSEWQEFDRYGNRETPPVINTEQEHVEAVGYAVGYLAHLERAVMSNVGGLRRWYGLNYGSVRVADLSEFEQPERYSYLDQLPAAGSDMPGNADFLKPQETPRLTASFSDEAMNLMQPEGLRSA